MKVRIDSELCQGHQLCAVFAPDVFGADDEGFAVLTDGTTEGTIDRSLADQAVEARDSCPEAAIELETK